MKKEIDGERGEWLIRCSLFILVHFIVMFSPFSNVVFDPQAEASTPSLISPSIYDEEIHAVKTPPFSKNMPLLFY